MTNKSLCEVVRDAEDNLLRGTVQISEYVTHDAYDTLNKIDAYLNSVHISSKTDSLGREKPFFNIVTAASNIWYRATDIDRKNIRILPDSQKTVIPAFVYTVLLRNWMKEARFGMFLNEWGRTLARYGSAVVKFVEKGGQLTATVVPWNRLVFDPIDFSALPTIEKFYLTPEQLKKRKEYDQEVVASLMESLSARETLEGDQKDNQDNFIELYEIHGELPLALLEDEIPPADDPKWEVYRQQMHVVSFIGGKDGKHNDYTLFKGKEAKHPYMITHLIPEDGRTLAIGAVEHLFEAQWITNTSQKNIKDILDLSSKLIFQTADAKFVGRNVLNAIESGDILIHSAGNPLTQINNSKSDIAALQNWGSQWQSLAQEITSTPDALRGNTMPSGTPYSLGALLSEQGNSLFELMTENKGLYLEDMINEYVIPFLEKKTDTKDEIVAILDEQGVTEIDAVYIPNEAVRRYNFNAKEEILNGSIPSPFNKEVEEAGVRADLNKMGNKRVFSPDELGKKSWKEIFKDFEKKCVVEITNENVDKQAVLTTLSTVLQTIASNPTILQDPNARMVFGQILSQTGVLSPIQFTSTSPPTGDAGALAVANQNGQTTGNSTGRTQLPAGVVS